MDEINHICGSNVKDQLYSTVAELKSDVREIRVSQLTAEDNVKLDRLRPEAPPSELPYESCMDGTRVDILEDIRTWVFDIDGPNIFWLYGHPGTGKSTIAVSVRDWLRKSGKLGASFFFRRSETAFQSPSSLWRSIAYQLAQKYLPLRKLILERLHDGEFDLSSSTQMEIFEAFVKNPLTAFGASDEPLEELPVIVIDALDECGGLDNHSSYLRNVLAALHLWPSLSSRIKIFLTSRDYGNIGTTLGVSSNKCKALEVGAKVTLQSSADIRLYLKRNLEDIGRQYNTVSSPWPTEAEIEMLTQAAAGLFIWASTVVNLVSRGPPSALSKLLRKIQDGDRGSNLSDLYNAILTTTFIDIDHVNLFREFAGAVIVARTPLTVATLAELLQSDIQDVEFVCKSLQPVLSSSWTLYFLHQSFVDFLISESCTDGFRCNLDGHEQRLAIACFTTMRRDLFFNIGGFESSYSLNCDVPGLANRISDCLYYSCRFWSDHLLWSPLDFVTEDLIMQFLQDQLLYWLEVLSITAYFGIAIKNLSTLLKWVQDCRNDITLMARDALSFVRSFAIPISQSSPQIYLSALAFSPLNSIVRKRYIQKYPGLLGLKTGYHLGWPSQQGCLRGHQSSVTGAAFTPDGQRIVSCSYDATLRVWDLDTQLLNGEPLRGHYHRVLSFAFFPDGQRIVSCSADSTLRIWDLETQKQIGEPFHCHDERVWSVNVSPDGQRIVSSSGECAIRIWDSKTLQQIGELYRGHGKIVYSVAFSPDGQSLVSSSNEGVRVWDAYTHQQIGGSIQCRGSFAFSPDGSKIAIGLPKGGFRICNAITLRQLGPVSDFYNFVESLVFSRNGERIAAGSDDGFIYICNPSTLEQIGEPLRGHTGEVSSLSFSPDGQRIMSGSTDSTIRIWDLSNSQDPSSHSEPQGHVGAVHSVAFSPDGRRIVSGSYDSTIRLWDTDTMEQIGKPLDGQDKNFNSVDFLPDGKRIISASDKGTLCVWDADLQELLQELDGGDGGSKAYYLFHAVLSPDRQMILSRLEYAVCIWDAYTLERLGKLSFDNVVISAEFSPDGRSVGLGLENGSIHIVKADNMEVRRESRQRHSGTVQALFGCLAFTPDGQKVVSTSNDSTIRVWDTKTLDQIGEPLKGHEDIVCAVAVSPGGQWIVSGSWDCTIRLWDMVTHKQIGHPLKGHESAVNSLSISPDERRIISGSDDSTVRLWDVETFLEDHRNSSPTYSFAFPDNNSINHSIFTEDGGLSPESVTIQPDGWVLGTNNERLFWVPHDLIPSLPRPYLLGIGGRQMIRFDPSNFHHGLEWTRCRANA